MEVQASSGQPQNAEPTTSIHPPTDTSSIRFRSSSPFLTGDIHLSLSTRIPPPLRCRGYYPNANDATSSGTHMHSFLNLSIIRLIQL